MRCEYPVRKADGTWAHVTISSTFLKADLSRLFWGLACMALDFDVMAGDTPVSVLRGVLESLEAPKSKPEEQAVHT